MDFCNFTSMQNHNDFEMTQSLCDLSVDSMTHLGIKAIFTQVPSKAQKELDN